MRKAEKTCPDCAETIKAAAVVCRYCGYRFSPNDTDAGQREQGEASAPPPAIAVTPATPPRSTRRRGRRIAIAAVAIAAIGVGLFTVVGRAGGPEPQEVVRQYATAMASGHVGRGCAMMTAAGGDEISLAAVKYLSAELGTTVEHADLLSQQIKDLAGDRVCETSGETLVNPQFRVKRFLNEEIDADGTSRVQDIDVTADGDEATVSTAAGVWVLNERQRSLARVECSHLGRPRRGRED